MDITPTHYSKRSALLENITYEVNDMSLKELNFLKKQIYAKLYLDGLSREELKVLFRTVRNNEVRVKKEAANITFSDEI